MLPYTNFVVPISLLLSDLNILAVNYVGENSFVIFYNHKRSESKINKVIAKHPELKFEKKYVDFRWGSLVKFMRELQLTSQEQLAKKMHCSRQHISSIERNLLTPTRNDVLAFTKIFKSLPILDLNNEHRTDI